MRIISFALAFAISTQAVAADKSGDKQTAATRAQPDKEKLICRREVPIGSLIATRKTCLTALQWRKQAENAEAEAERMNPHIAVQKGN